LGVTPDKVIWKVVDVATAEDKSKKKWFWIPWARYFKWGCSQTI